MVSANILQRVYKVKYQNNFWAWFTIHRNWKEYLISAKHIFKDFESENWFIEILNSDKWYPITVKKIDCIESVDIIIFEWESPLLSNLEIEIGEEFFVSQDAYFLGFPFWLETDWLASNNWYPIPFVKKCTISGFDLKNPKTIYLDWHNNKWFSGGPLITIEKQKMNIIWVISWYLCDQDEDKIQKWMKENSGIFFAHKIIHAIDAIDRAD